jgi:hypothetical protein
MLATIGCVSVRRGFCGSSAFSSLVLGFSMVTLSLSFWNVSENVSTAPGIDASATCYRRAENVPVRPCC